MVDLFQKFSPFENALHVFDKMPYWNCSCLWLVSELSWIGHVFAGLILILAGPWLEQRPLLDFILLNLAKGKGEDVQVALLLKGQ